MYCEPNKVRSLIRSKIVRGVLFYKYTNFIPMEKEIDGYHIRITQNKEQWTVHPNKQLIPLYMSWDAENSEWRFNDGASSTLAEKVFQGSKTIEKKISDFIDEVSNPPVKKRAEKYEEKTPIKGTFLEIMQAAAKNANDKSAPKKDGQEG